MISLHDFPSSFSYLVIYWVLRADGVCQGCDEPAPFTDTDGEPFLEVHHLQRRSDGGPDHPDNVVALCPNCHRRVHHGPDGEAFDRALLESAGRYRT
ncbi:HNH endonuclease [Salinadaptatus halalkaliphilus]|uniref:HNH endonuclease n=1 Tax=Salinadaptatus halalkaliphilus TaxID=2419781 RepID=A0A4S3TL62_9EURY|nr:HNH endonuclease signature motif containing protein [Salinadaptatus halalkaliphilus]THE64894.1 HNH endonuclease [Salinadaptatus halalkaliphilus]